MTNEKVYVNNFIEDYEERLYKQYKLSKQINGRFDEKTNKIHAEWKNILKFIYDEDVNATFTFDQLEDTIKFLGSKSVYHANNPEYMQYWEHVNKMYYYICELVKKK